ncbi:MAG: hypothetical protein HY070_03050 [Chloroflexi bacterium]|nr:hypothetical protein [Chloroflexota bacterium]MBI3738738.1 hypothetical protein [Chloroflexota bacterium]
MEILTPEQVIEKEKQIIAQGWTRQFTAFVARVPEYVELYEGMGYEVRVEDWALSPESDPSCNDCALMGIMRTIFTRKRNN